MKRFIKFSIWILLTFVFFTGCYYYSFQRLLDKYKQQEIENKNDMLQLADNEYEHSIDELSTVPADSGQDYRIKPNAAFFIETYFSGSGELLREQIPAPPEFVGLNREETEKLLVEYMQGIPLSEHEKGLKAYEMISFSATNVILRKTYEQKADECRFFLTARNDYIVVYYSDMKSIYEYTQIEVSKLTDENKALVIKGIDVKGLEELYDILAAFTS